MPTVHVSPHEHVSRADPDIPLPAALSWRHGGEKRAAVQVGLLKRGMGERHKGSPTPLQRRDGLVWSDRCVGDSCGSRRGREGCCCGCCRQRYGCCRAVAATVAVAATAPGTTALLHLVIYAPPRGRPPRRVAPLLTPALQGGGGGGGSRPLRTQQPRQPFDTQAAEVVDRGRHRPTGWPAGSDGRRLTATATEPPESAPTSPGHVACSHKSVGV